MSAECFWHDECGNDARYRTRIIVTNHDDLELIAPTCGECIAGQTLVTSGRTSRYGGDA